MADAYDPHHQLRAAAMLRTGFGGVARVNRAADKYGQLEDKHSCAWSVVLDILGTRVVQGPDSRVISC
jgi:hypothetical protein